MRHYARFVRHPAPVQAVPAYEIDREELPRWPELLQGAACLVVGLVVMYFGTLGALAWAAGR